MRVHEWTEKCTGYKMHALNTTVLENKRWLFLLDVRNVSFSCVFTLRCLALAVISSLKCLQPLTVFTAEGPTGILCPSARGCE